MQDIPNAQQKDTTNTGFGSYLAEMWFAPLILSIDSFIVNNVLLGF